MSSDRLAKLAKIGKLKAEPPAQDEFDALLASGRTRLADARNNANALVSRFDLAYNAAHAMALAALRWHGFRSENRYLVFQVLPHTLGLEDAQWRVLAICHDRRNRFEYQGVLDVDARLLEELIAITGRLEEAVKTLGAAPLTRP